SRPRSRASSSRNEGSDPPFDMADMRKKILRASASWEMASNASMSSSQWAIIRWLNGPGSRTDTGFADQALSYIRTEVGDAGDAHLRRQLRLGRQAADRPAEDRRRKQVPPDLDRASRGGGHPHEAAEPGAAAADDSRPAQRHARAARRADHPHHRHGAAREH